MNCMGPCAFLRFSISTRAFIPFRAAADAIASAILSLFLKHCGRRCSYGISTGMSGTFWYLEVAE